MTKELTTLLVGHFNNNWDLLSQFVNGLKITGAVTSGEEAINCHGVLMPEIIFLDVFLPGMTGFETARFLREQQSSSRIILVSENFQFDFLLIAIDLGLDGYIAKDMDAQILASSMTNIHSGKPCFDSAINHALNRE